MRNVEAELKKIVKRGTFLSNVVPKVKHPVPYLPCRGIATNQHVGALEPALEPRATLSHKNLQRDFDNKGTSALSNDGPSIVPKNGSSQSFQVFYQNIRRE